MHRIEPPNGLERIPPDPPAAVYPAAADVSPDELVLGVGTLASELPRVQGAVQTLQLLPYPVHHRQEGLLVLHHPAHVVHIADIVEAVVVRLPVVEVVQQVVVRVLPYQEAEGAADAVGLAEDRLLSGVVLPEVPRGLPVAVLRGEGVYRYQHQVQQVVLVIPVIVLLYDPADLPVGDVQRDIREEALEVSVDNPRLASETLRHLPQVLDEAVDSHIRPVADTVVKAPLRHPSVEQGTESLVDVVLRYPPVHVRGEHLPGTGTHSDEDIGSGLQGAVVDGGAQTHEIALIVYLVHYAVAAAPLVRAAHQVGVYCIAYRHIPFPVDKIHKGRTPLAVIEVVVIYIAVVVSVPTVVDVVTARRPPGGHQGPTSGKALNESGGSFLSVGTAVILR